MAGAREALVYALGEAASSHPRHPFSWGVEVDETLRAPSYLLEMAQVGASASSLRRLAFVVSDLLLMTPQRQQYLQLSR